MTVFEAIDNVERFAATIKIRKKVPGLEINNCESTFITTEEKLPAVMVIAMASKQMPEIDRVMEMFLTRKMEPLMYVNEMKKLLIEWNETRMEKKYERIGV